MELSIRHQVHSLFEAQVVRNPEAVAIVAGTRLISYNELNARANALAHRLVSRGLKPGTFVGLLADRSVEMVAGILGILKAGAVYVPLNVNYPIERLTFLVKDAALPLIVTSPRYDGLVAALGAPALEFPEQSEISDLNPDVESTPDALAYVIYTSGSTGQPKGVGLPHAGLVSLLTFTREQMQIHPGDRVLQFASFSFDASLWEILAALVSGAAVVLGTSEELMPGPSLHALMRRQRVTIVLLSPSVLQILPSADLDALRIIIAGTEKLSSATVARWKTPGRRFFNAYGPTEATIYQLIWEAPDDVPPSNPPIGTPIPGVQVFLLDKNLKPVEEGASGELCLAGACLGCGYINRPEITREAFISVPLGLNGEAIRIYRTGDRARRWPDGNYEYLGRLDLQLKVRGFRVEPGEIETTLSQHPGVDSSAVVAVPDGSGQARLWAYFISRADPAPANADLKTFLAAKLPAYMIPSGFTAMAHWPLNANGKLDRQRLPLPSSEETAMRPLSPLEQQLLSWCREILGIDGLGPESSLLDAGFHSLAFAQLAWRIQNAYGTAPCFADMFTCASVSALAALIDARSNGSRAPLERVTAADRGERPPLSSAQERVWFLEQLHPGNNAYRFQSVLKFYGSTNVSALESALNEIVKRHEILRTTFPQFEGRPFQRIHPYEPFTLPVEVLSATDAQAKIDRCIRQRFDLSQLPLVHWRLFRIGPEEHWLLHTEHHLLHDGWGYGVFLRELFTAYDALAASRQPELPPLPIQFADLAAWQKRQFDRGVWDNQLDYWAQTLKDAGVPPHLPSNEPPPAVQTFAGDQIRHTIDPKQYADLTAACLREHVTPYMWLHAAFQTFLHRYTGHADIIVGSGIANRRLSESHGLLGMLINTVAIRTDFAADPTFRDVLEHFRDVTALAIDNQDAPYDKVVLRLNSGFELFNCFFDSYDQAFPAYRKERLRVDSEDGISNGRCKFDLTALVIPGERSPTLLWEFNTDLFARSTAERMMRHFLTLVSSSVKRPDLPVSKLPILSVDERYHLIQLGRGRESAIPGNRIECIFAERVAANPGAEAVVCGNERLTYAELDRLSEDLAVRIRNSGVVPGDVVAFSLARGSAAICAMLAILKCGCAYMPLDPSLPTPRRDVLLKAASAVAIVTGEGITALTPSSNASLGRASERADDAYVMFTSGSTGMPKAVFAPHLGVIRLVCDADYVRLNASTRFLQFAPLSFDASTLEIWGPLLNGGTVIVHPEDVPDPHAIGKTIATHKVTTAWFTAALFNRIVDTATHILRPLREVLTGGEALSPHHVARALSALPSTTVINGYGPTESTTFATTYTVPRTFATRPHRVPIGTPVPRTQVYVLDPHGDVQPMGVVGELYIGGAGLGRVAGPSDAPSAFVEDPFAPRPGSRLYRTGDRARLLEDGNFDFIERIDRQVKIHGYRIEPGEIESVLARHPDVREVAVLAVTDPAGERRLIAYLALTPHSAANAIDAVREFSSMQLPPYMVPSSFVRVPVLPLTQQGKLDVRALEQLAPAASSVGVPSVSDVHEGPRTSLQAVVAGVWAQVLGMESPAIDDNFFDVGGHSLLAMQLIHQLNVALGLKLPLRLLFTDPTIAGIARAIETEFSARFNQPKRYAALVPLKPGGDRRPFFLVAGGVGGENELIVYAGLARYLDPRRPFFGLRARGIDELVEPHDNVEDMAAEYNREIRRVQPHGPYTISGSCVAGVVALEMAHQLRRAGEEVRTLVLIDSVIPRWSRLMRSELLNFWTNRLRPDIDRARSHGLVQFVRDWRRRRANPSPDEQIADRQIRIMRTYLARLTAYKPQSYSGDVVFLRAAETDVEEAKRWRSIATGRFEMHDIPGDHYSHLREHAKVTAMAIEKCLDADDIPATSP